MLGKGQGRYLRPCNAKDILSQKDSLPQSVKVLGLRNLAVNDLYENNTKKM